PQATLRDKPSAIADRAHPMPWPSPVRLSGNRRVPMSALAACAVARPPPLAIGCPPWRSLGDRAVSSPGVNPVYGRWRGARAYAGATESAPALVAGPRGSRRGDRDGAVAVYCHPLGFRRRTDPL